MRDRLLKESDVLKAIDKRIEALSKDPEFVRKNGIVDVMGIKKYILAIPSVDRPKGEWINLKISISGDSSAECSLCGAVVHNNFSNVINFCPNCGVKMRGRDDE